MINEHEIFNEKRLYNIIKLGLAATGTNAHSPKDFIKAFEDKEGKNSKVFSLIEIFLPEKNVSQLNNDLAVPFLFSMLVSKLFNNHPSKPDEHDIICPAENDIIELFCHAYAISMQIEDSEIEALAVRQKKAINDMIISALK